MGIRLVSFIRTPSMIDPETLVASAFAAIWSGVFLGLILGVVLYLMKLTKI